MFDTSEGGPIWNWIIEIADGRGADVVAIGPRGPRSRSSPGR
jgi:hypothetical protein